MDNSFFPAAELLPGSPDSPGVLWGLFWVFCFFPSGSIDYIAARSSGIRFVPLGETSLSGNGDQKNLTLGCSAYSSITRLRFQIPNAVSLALNSLPSLPEQTFLHIPRFSLLSHPTLRSFVSHI